MKISRSWLQSYFDKSIPDAAVLSDLFTLHAFEVEGMERFGEDDIFDVKILPDRAHYALSHKGVAEEVSVLAKMPLKASRIPSIPADEIVIKPQVRIDAPLFCRRYMARYAEIDEVKASNHHATVMLESIGQRAINSVVDATNVTMFDCGQPLHIFDADTIQGGIVVRAARKGERIQLLDFSAGADRDVELLETDHVIADDSGPIAIAGVKGGKKTGVTDKTRRIIIESANFAPDAVRRTATRLNLRSESSKRFENEITPELTVQGMVSVCGLLKHNIPATKFGPIVDMYPQPAKQVVIEFDPGMIENRLGIQIPLGEARAILEGMRITVVEKSGKWLLTPPFERLDLVIPEDFVEEVGRVYGYEHVKGVLPPKSDKPVTILPSFYMSEKIRNLLVEAGFSEVSLYSLVAKGEVETAYPLARDKAFARASLVGGMMDCVEKNALNADLLGLDTIKVFEIGRVFGKAGERIMLALGVAQVKKVKGLSAQKAIADVLVTLSQNLYVDLGGKDITVKNNHAVVEIDLTELLKVFKLPANASYTDLAFGSTSTNKFTKFSHYPFIVRDIAVFVPESVTDGEVWKQIETGLGDQRALLVRRSLFDTFKKDGKVSYAFRMVFQSDERTLTDDEVKQVMDRVYANMKSQSWEVR